VDASVFKIFTWPHPTPGEPEALKYLTGYSRRINKKDRMTYDINEAAKEVVIFRMRGAL
jgi:Txe/YoeB family toxin of Txe-Axe toxin-antitoxin module